jgi:hypothetical protein
MKLYGLAAAAALVIAGCGPKSSQGDDDGTGDDGGGDDGTTPDAPVFPPQPDAPACLTDTVNAVEAVRPVDIVWVIDNSGSMDAEEARIQSNMNSFAASISATGTDYHVIVIADTGHVNVPPPLNPSPHFLGINQSIDSHDALEQIVLTYPQYQAFLRPDSIKHFVVVTDDESDWSRATFEAQLAALTAPGFGTDWRFHAVVAEGWPWDLTSPCFALSAAVGAIYLDLQVAHAGLFFSLCSTDWTPLFTTLAETVTDGLSLPCTYTIPPPPDGVELDPNQVNFSYTPTGGSPVTIPNVGSMAGCAGDGWYYDDPVAPTQIIVCPQTCDTIQGGGTVSVEFGCATIID